MACAYRTVSEVAVLIIAGAVPTMATEKARLYKLKSEVINPNEAKETVRKDIIKERKTKWQKSDNGRWMESLIQNIEHWLARNPAKPSFILHRC